MNAYIITIGDELLIGQVIDSNSAWIAEQLNLIGITVTEIISISDDHNHITTTLEQLEHKTNLVIITGGLGPTRDDITKPAISAFLGTTMTYREDIYQHICYLFNKINKPIEDINKDQCYFPSTTTIIQNEVGTAPGMWFQKEKFHILSMPGVPHEMKYIMKNGGLERVAKLHPNPTIILHRTIKTAGVGEDVIAREIDPIVDKLPNHIKIAYLPSLHEVRLRLSAYGDQRDKLQTELDQYVEIISDHLGSKVYGYDDDNLSSVVGSLLANKNLTISTAESCTIGLAGHTIGATAGASQYYCGSVISYSNDIKTSILKVSPETLNNDGAVSESCVKEMLVGLLNSFKTDTGITISGIAGPGGGSKEKPVGTTWIAYGTLDDIRTKKLKFGRDREKNMLSASTAALNLMRLYLNEKI